MLVKVCVFECACVLLCLCDSVRSINYMYVNKCL